MNENQQETGKVKNKKRLLLIAAMFIAVLIGVGYGYGCWFFQSHFLPRTSINEFDCSFKTVGEVTDLFDKKVKAYALAVNTRNGGVEKISADNIGMKYKDDGAIQEKLENQNNWLWIVMSKHVIDLKVSYSLSEEKLRTAVEGLKCFKNNIPPEDAKIVLVNGKFKILPETNGTMLDKERVIIVIETAVRQGNASVDLDECYSNPEIRKDDKELIKKCKELNKIKDIVITYDFGDRKETLDIEKLFKLTTDYEFDSSKVANYISKLAKKYDTKGEKRNFVTYDDRQIEVTGGDYGWVIDQDKSAKALLETIKKGKSEVIQPVYKQEAKSRNANDIDYTYLEIDKENECIVLYKDGQPVFQEHGIVTGNLPDGCYIAGTYEDVHEEDDEDLLWWLPFGNDLCIYSTDSDTADTQDSEEEISSEEDSDDESTDVNEDTDDENDTEVRTHNENTNGFRMLEAKAQNVCRQTEKGFPVIVY